MVPGYIKKHINSVILEYSGEIPLALYLKNYFRKNPSAGSKDRRLVAACVNNWFRCAKAFNIARNTTDDELLNHLIIFCYKSLQTTKSNAVVSLRPFLENDYKIDSIQTDDLFPFALELSQGINKTDWLNSMLSQPDLFIRTRKNIDEIAGHLLRNNIEFDIIEPDCIALPNGTQLDKYLKETDYVVQDASSRQTGLLFNATKNESWWDCCCGAGGKSLMLADKQPDLDLTVSDIRPSIIKNLVARFQQYELTQPKALCIDATDLNDVRGKLSGKLFDNIICDAPCSGSGTWARTPESMYFFDPATIPKFSNLQKKIALNALQFLKKEGKFYYITCSVFQKENEEIVNEISQNTNIKLLSTNLLNGTGIKADSMFISTFSKE